MIMIKNWFQTNLLLSIQIAFRYALIIGKMTGGVFLMRLFCMHSFMGYFNDMCICSIVSTRCWNHSRNAYLWQSIRCSDLACKYCSGVREKNEDYMLIFRHMFISFLFHCILFHWLSWLSPMSSLLSLFGGKVPWKRNQLNRVKNRKCIDWFLPNDRQSSVWRPSLPLSRMFSFLSIDDHQMESSIRNARSLGVIPRAKIKTVKMTLVIVIGKFSV